jgi:hypothetical protein
MGLKQAPQIDRVRDDEATRIRAYPRVHRLEGAPHVIFKSQRGQLVRGIPSRESFRTLGPSLVNGVEPHLANPRKRFHGRVSGPRANPYQTGHGRPLESPDNNSTRNPQSTTRSMGVAETSPSVPQRDGEGAFKYKTESTPRSPRIGPGSGARRTATPPRERRTQATPDMCAWCTEAGWNIADVG